MKKRNIMIDGARLILAILIVMIHYGGNVGIYKFMGNTIGRIGVPIFMIITGYYFFEKAKKNNLEYMTNILKKINKKFVIMSVFWTFFYLYRARITLKNDSIIVICLKIFRSFWGFNFAAGMLWYLVATLIGLNIVFFLYKTDRIKIAYILAFCAWIIDLCSTNYLNIFGFNNIVLRINSFISPACTFITGILWITVAFIINNHKDYLRNIFSVKILFVLYIFFLSEYFFITSHITKVTSDMFITLPFIVVGTFLLMINHNISIESKKIVVVKKLATLIFLLQHLSGDIFNYLSSRINIHSIDKISFPIILSIDFILSITYIILSNSRYMYFLNVFIGENLKKEK